MIEEKSWSALGSRAVSWALLSVVLNTAASFSEPRDTIGSTSEYGGGEGDCDSERLRVNSGAFCASGSGFSMTSAAGMLWLLT